MNSLRYLFSAPSSASIGGHDSSQAVKGEPVESILGDSSPAHAHDHAQDRQQYDADIPLPPSPTLSTTPLLGTEHDEDDELEGEKKLFLRRQALLDSALAAVQRQQRSVWERWYFFFRRLLRVLFAMPPENDTEEAEEEKPSIRRTKLFYTSSPPSALDERHRSGAPAKRSKAAKVPHLTPKTLVLDLDETLVHSTSRPYAGKGAGLKVRVVEVVLEGKSTVYTVYKRPWVDYFLRKVSKWYTVVIFTASLPEYADPVIDWLDGGDGGGGIIGGRLFRSDCRHTNGAYMKDLSIISKDLSHVCLVDNSPTSYAINQANGIPIEGWINDPHDECLLDLLPVLDSLRFTTDVRRVLGMRGWSTRPTHAHAHT